MNRYSCRDFQEKLPSAETLLSIAKAGIAAPSGMNQKPWSISCVTSQSLIRELEETGLAGLDETQKARIASRGGTLFYHAPVIYVVAIAPGTQMDCGIVLENIALAAAGLGLDSVICGLAGLAFTPEKKEYFAQKLSFPKGYEFGCSVLVGYGKEKGSPKELDMSKIVMVSD
jgi:nitroreductase